MTAPGPEYKLHIIICTIIIITEVNHLQEHNKVDTIKSHTFMNINSSHRGSKEYGSPILAVCRMFVPWT